VEAAELLQNISVPAWKISSGDGTNLELLSFVTDTRKPVLLSSGMSTWSEISYVVDFCRNKGCPVAVFQCTSTYPVELSHVGLNIISEIESRLGVPAGLSDHSGTVSPSLAAMALGASLIEVHVVFDRKMFGPDTVASIALDDLAFLVQAREAFWEMEAPVDKDRMAHNLREMKETFGRSLALKIDLPSGTILEKHHVTLKKPGGGISYGYVDKVIGRKLTKAVSSNRLLRWEDLGGKVE
jgi:N-acetylneuraminate synthase